jgi:hypothetical protein
MSNLAKFFKGSDTTLGVFYPNHYLIAVFRNVEVAQQVLRRLQAAGFGEDEAIATGGEEVIALANEETGLGSFFMQALSRFFSTEQKYTDHDLEHARHEAGFVAVHCPTEASKKKAWVMMQSEALPENPLSARYYASGGIEHLAGDFDTD